MSILSYYQVLPQRISTHLDRDGLLEREMLLLRDLDLDMLIERDIERDLERVRERPRSSSAIFDTQCVSC